MHLWEKEMWSKPESYQRIHPRNAEDGMNTNLSPDINQNIMNL